VKTFALHLAAAPAEIVGCYLPWLRRKQNGSTRLLLPAAAGLAAFAWLLTLMRHPVASMRPAVAPTSASPFSGYGPWTGSAHRVGT